MTPQNFFWLVGMLEGEGFFCHGPPSRPNKPSVGMSSTDNDVAKRVHRLIGGHLNKRNRTIETGNRHKDIWEIKLSGRPALALMRELQPHMSRRRQQRIKEVLRLAPPIGTSPSTPGKLSAKDKVQIRREYATGRYSQEQIARKYRVSQSRISGVIRSTT
jgi:hypothetical protein